MGLNASNSNLLLQKYELGIVETIRRSSNMYKTAKRVPFTGNQIEFRVESGLSAALGNADEGDAFPVSDNSKRNTAQIGRKVFHAAIELTDVIMAAGKGSPAVARDALESEIRNMLDGSLKYMNAMFYLDGSGKVSTIRGSAGAVYDVDWSPLLWEGAHYEVTQPDGSTVRASDAALVSNGVRAGVSATTQAFGGCGPANVVEFTAAIASSAAGDQLFWRGSGAASPSSRGRAFSGLDKLINNETSGTFQGLTMANNRRYVSTVVDAAYAALNPSHIRKLQQGLAARKGDRPGALKLMGNPAQLVKFSEMYESNLRASASDSKVGSAATVFQSPLGAVELDFDSDCPPHMLFGVDPSQIFLAETMPLGWRLQGSEMLLRSDLNSKNTATLYAIMDMYIKSRHTSGKISNLAFDLPHGI